MRRVRIVGAPVLVLLLPLSLVFSVDPAWSADVELSGERWRTLQSAGHRETPPVTPPRPALGRLRAALDVDGTGVGFVAAYDVWVPVPGWWHLPVVSADVRLEALTFRGDPVPTSPRVVDGSVVAAFWVPGDGVLEVRGHLPGPVVEPRALGLPLAGGVVSVEGDAQVEVVGGVPLGDRRFGIGDRALAVAPAPPRRDEGTLVFGEVAVGLTVGEEEVAGKAALRWRISRGSLARVAFALPGAPEDLEIEGPQVASWRRAGERVVVDLLGDEGALVQVAARWSERLPAGDEVTLAIPSPRLEGTFRGTTALQLARDGQLEVVPRTELPGVAASALPDWARGLVEGASAGAYLGAADAVGDPAATVYRVVPAQGPPTLVDVAHHTVATTADGRVLMRSHLAVRNDRGDFLRFTPPPGLQVVATLVAGEPVRVSYDDGTLLIPLARSVETVEGLLTFPIEVSLLGEREAWSGREARALPLPELGAEVAVSRATVFLPPRYRPRRPRSARIVEAFTEGQGISYGFATGDVRAAKADALFRQAVAAWMKNDFDDARGYLDDLDVLGADNEDVGRLRSNLAYVMGEAEVADVAQARRVKDLARARASKQVVEQRKVLEEAEQKEAEGDYAAAEEAYGRALSIGGVLQQVAPDEDLEYARQAQELTDKLADVKKRARSGSETPPEPIEEPEVVLSFEGGEVSGELLQPQSEMLSARARERADDLPAPTVSAVSRSVVVPALGTAVRYQRVLLPEGAADAVPLRARRTRRTP